MSELRKRVFLVCAACAAWASARFSFWFRLYRGSNLRSACMRSAGCAATTRTYEQLSRGPDYTCRLIDPTLCASQRKLSGLLLGCSGLECLGKMVP